MAINIPAPTRLLTLSARAPSSPPDSPDLNPRPDSTCVPWIPDPAKSHALKPTYSITSSTINTQDHSKRGSLNLESHMWATCNDDKPLYSSDSGPSLSSGKRSARCGRITLVIIGVASVILLGVFLPLHFGVLRSLHHGNTVPLSRGNETNSQPTTHTLLRGGDGSEVTTADGTKFTYRNPFGGFWISDPEDPFNLDAQPNEWTPPLNRSWRWGQDRIFGVNLGGLFVLEPFITPGVFEARPGSVDEYTLSEMMRDGVNGTQGFQDLEEHYKTFITEKDIAEIAGAGLNWLRVPLGFWAVEVYENEPFLERTSWTYFLRIVEWARKYGLRIYLDLHAVPGGQNGMNHSGRVHRISFLAGNMGLANAQRTLYYLRVLTEFISQPQYSSVIPVLGILNEPLSEELGMEALSSFYLEAYTMIRNITGYGEGNGPYIAIGDGLRSPLDWEGLLPNADRVIMDAHPYVAFDRSHDTSPLTDLAEDGEFGGIWPRTACQRWGPLINSTRKMALGVTIGGEFSGALNDCGRYIREVGVTSDHPQCRLYDDWENWTDELKAGLQNFILASMDAIGDFFFWTWKIGPSIEGKITAPFWSYKLGLEQGWIPRDPRTSFGKCARLGISSAPFDGTYKPWQTGDFESEPTIPAEYLANNAWPPGTLTRADMPVALLPTYATTGSVITLPVPTYSGAPASATENLRGWYNDADTRRGVTPIGGCKYPDPYVVKFDVLPTARCGE